MENPHSEDAHDMKLLLASETVMLGEPIILHYDVADHGNAGLWLYLGRELSAWANLSLVDETGQPAPERPNPRKTQGGLQSATQLSLDPGQTYHGSLIITQWLTVPHIGRYELHLKARIPYIPRTPLDVPGEQVGGFPFRLWHQKTKTVFVQEQSFPIIVTEPEEAHLRQIAEGLRQTALNRTHYNHSVDAIRALLGMPEPYSLASWQALASDPSFRHKDDLMRELAHVMSPAAADLLAQMWNPGYGPMLATTLASVLLDNMYRAGDEALKRHIEGIFARYGKKVSEHGLIFPG